MRNSLSGRLARKPLEEETEHLLRQFIQLIMNTNIVSEETKYYISDSYITYSGVTKQLAFDTGTERNPNTVQAKVYYDRNKIIRLFGEDIITNIVELQAVSKFPEYREKIARAYSRYGKTVKIWNNIALKIPTVNETEETKEVNLEKLAEFMSVLQTYSKTQIKTVEENIDKAIVAYCNRIMTSTMLSEQEKEHKELLEQIII